MAWRLFGPSYYLNQCWVIINWTLRNKFHWNCNQNTKLFIHEKCIWKYRLQNGSHFVQGKMSQGIKTATVQVYFSVMPTDRCTASGNNQCLIFWQAYFLMKISLQIHELSKSTCIWNLQWLTFQQCWGPVYSKVLRHLKEQQEWWKIVATPYAGFRILPANIVEADSLQAFKAGFTTLTPAAPDMP